jgi:hypothetical protein
LETGELGHVKENLDLWNILREVFLQANSGGILIAHVPSHMDPALCDHDFESWAARGNRAADRLAVAANQNRSTAVQALHDQARNWQQATWRTATSLRSIYLAIAEQTGGPQHAMEDEEAVEELEVPLPPEHEVQDRLSECVALGWRADTATSSQVLPARVMMQIFDWILRLDVHGGPARAISWLELAVMLFLDPNQQVPAMDVSGRWTFDEPLFPSPRGRLLASLFSLIRTVVRKQALRLHLGQFILSHVDVSVLGSSFRWGSLFAGRRMNCSRVLAVAFVIAPLPRGGGAWAI